MLLVVSAPLQLVIACAIAADDGWPVLYSATRIGRDGAPFTLYKFRTMAARADGPGITGAGDPRVTRVGRVLRSTKLDELPQLYNVLRGDMSIVGPRPEAPEYVRLYTPAQRDVLRVRPGLTSPASLAFSHEEHLLVGPDAEQLYVRTILPEKLRLDLDYLSRRTLRSDLGVIARTVARVVTPGRRASR